MSAFLAETVRLMGREFNAATPTNKNQAFARFLGPEFFPEN